MMEEIKKHLLAAASAEQWKKIGIRPHHGIDLPLSALRTNKSCGIGEFYDLIPLIDWCEKLHLDVIQLLPLNNSEIDPSPYNAMSSCAINFAYLSLYALPFLDELPDLQAKLKDFIPLNASDYILYADVHTHKLNWLHAYFDAVGAKLLNTTELKNFIANHSWVEPYALFKALRSKFSDSPWTSWPAELRAPSDKEYEEVKERYWPDVSFYITLQYLCYCQLKEIKIYANQHNVFLMGDIPILLSGDSADVWRYPQYFDTSLAAGVPPDAYSAEGQYWGFPLFRWEVLRKENYDWWKNRLAYASNFYDIYRVDHVIGFFRLWGIPINHLPKEGKYIPEDEVQWNTQGRDFLNMLLTSSSMLPIAEDLGVAPKILPICLKELGICGTKLLRWERNWETDKSFIPVRDYPPLSLSCVSTHDSESLVLWWKMYPEEAEALAQFKQWEYAPELTTAQHLEILRDSHHSSSLFHVNLLQEYLTLFPELSWPSPEQDRINVPGKVLPTNWTYRFKPSVEEITSHSGLFKAFQRILREKA